MSDSDNDLRWFELRLRDRLAKVRQEISRLEGVANGLERALEILWECEGSGDGDECNQSEGARTL